MLRKYNLYLDTTGLVNQSLIDTGIDATSRAMAACAYVRCLEDSKIPSSARQRDDARQWAAEELKHLRDISGIVARTVGQHLEVVDASVATVDFVSGAVIFFEGDEAGILAERLQSTTASQLSHSLDRELDFAAGYGITPPAEVDAAEVALMAQIETELESLEPQIEQMAEDTGQSLGKVRRGDGKDIAAQIVALNERRTEADKAARNKRRRWIYERYCQEVRG